MVEYVNYEEPKGAKLYKLGKYSFSTIEIKHLSIALVMITIAMMVLGRENLVTIGIIPFILIYLFTIGLGFLLHELGHKLVAQHYGYISEFRADFTMLFLAILMAFSGFLFLAPGAVMIMGALSKKENGIVSIAGPLVNLGLAIIFIILALVFHPSGIFEMLVNLGIYINLFLAIFNMLPIWVFDGKKVLAWSRIAYFSLVIILVLLIIGYFKGYYL